MASVRIPTIGPPAGPDFTPQDRTTEVSPVGAALQRFSDPLKEIGHVFQVQQENDNKIRFADQTAVIDHKVRAAKLAAAASPGTMQLDTYDQAMGLDPKTNQIDPTKLLDANGTPILQNPDNKAIIPELTAYANERYQKNRDEMMMSAFQRTVKDHETATASLGPVYANQEATAYAVDPKTGQIVDTADALTPRKNYMDLVNGVKGIMPEAREAMIRGYKQNVAKMRGQDIAQNHPELTNDYIAQHPELTPTEANSLREQMISSINQPHKIVDAALSADRARNDAAVLDALKAGVTPASRGLDVEKLMGHGQLSETPYRMATGHAYRDQFPDEPGMADRYQTMVDNQSPDGGEQLRRVIAEAHNNRVLSGPTAGDLMVKSYAKEKELKDPLNHAKYLARDELEAYIWPPKGLIKMPFDVEVKRDAFQARWNLEMSTAKTPKEVAEAEQRMKEWADKQKGSALGSGAAKGAVGRVLGGTP